MPDYTILPFRPEVPLLGERALQPSPPRTGLVGPEEKEPEEISFRESIRNFIQDVDHIQKEANNKVQDFIAGEISDVHDVMIAVEKASTSFQLLMELRNKFLDAYQELKRMQV